MQWKTTKLQQTQMQMHWDRRGCDTAFNTHLALQNASREVHWKDSRQQMQPSLKTARARTEVKKNVIANIGFKEWKKTSLYSSVCTSTAIGWSVCVNRKRKESKWKHKSLRDQNSLVHKTGRKDKLRNCRQGSSFLLHFSFVYRNKTLNSWERGGKQNTYQEKAHPRC